jgi:hypothetical protein
MKHIEVDYHFLQDQVIKVMLDVPFISTQDQVAVYKTFNSTMAARI